MKKILLFILVFASVGTLYVCLKQSKADNDILIRDCKVEQDEKNEAFISSFDNATLEIGDNNVVFNAEKRIKDFNWSNIDYISNDILNDNRIVKFEIEYFSETKKMILSAKFVNDNDIIIDSLQCFVFTNEKGEIDAFVSIEDENTFLMSDLNNKWVNNCGFLTKLFGGIGAGLLELVLPGASVLVGTIVVTADAFEKKKAVENYANNLRQTEPKSFINGQDYYSKWKFGFSTLDHNGCGVIAMYNVLVGLNRRIDLANVIFDFDINSATLGLGFFGTDPTHYPIYFKSIGLNYNTFLSYSNLQKAIKKMNNNQMILVCAWNGKNKSDGAHFVAASYNSNSINPVKVYNRYSNDKGTYSFSTFGKDIIGGDLITAFIVG